MHDPIHTFLDTMLTKKEPIKKFKKIRDRENREIKQFKNRRAREAVEGFQHNEEFAIPNVPGRAGLSGAPPGPRDELVERLSQQRKLSGMPSLPPLVGSGRRSRKFNYPFPSQASQEPPHARSNPATPKPSLSRPSKGRQRSATAPNARKQNPGIVRLTEYEDQSVVPKTSPKVTETKKEKRAKEEKREKSLSSKAKSSKATSVETPPGSRVSSRASSAKTKREKKDKGKKKDEDSDEEGGPPLSHYPMSDGASIKTELNRGIGDMRRSFVEGFLPSISSKGKR